MARPLRIEYPACVLSRDEPGQPSRGYISNISVEHIIGEVAIAGNAQTDDLRDRKIKLKDLRQMAMEQSYRYSNYKQKEISAIFGVDYSTVSQSRARLKTKLKSSRKVKK